ncbi:hypothetical protein CLOSYM_03935 [[Clostridium] symbiosum ATCC 14940]|uniref:Uncharacterized protein n=1 Tax=[Clostridium] symbiosum ATCC 14940 TaxID=411472 RepID=A0ABC9TTI0_CLOSY|nr:hypothetical protein CLOSYM_03935 [[Clostridium] symbiosum ATCC 14940]
MAVPVTPFILLSLYHGFTAAETIIQTEMIRQGKSLAEAERRSKADPDIPDCILSPGKL